MSALYYSRGYRNSTIQLESIVSSFDDDVQDVILFRI